MNAFSRCLCPKAEQIASTRECPRPRHRANTATTSARGVPRWGDTTAFERLQPEGSPPHAGPNAARRPLCPLVIYDCNKPVECDVSHRFPGVTPAAIPAVSCPFPHFFRHTGHIAKGRRCDFRGNCTPDEINQPERQTIHSQWCFVKSFPTLYIQLSEPDPSYSFGNVPTGRIDNVNWYVTILSR